MIYGILALVTFIAIGYWRRHHIAGAQWLYLFIIVGCAWLIIETVVGIAEAAI